MTHYAITKLTSSMDGLGGWGMRKNQMAEAKLSQVLATKSGDLSRVLASPYMYVENRP